MKKIMITMLLIVAVAFVGYAGDVIIWDGEADEMAVNTDGSINVVSSLDAYNATQWMPVWYDGNIVTFNLSYSTNTSHFYPEIDAYVYYKETK